MATPRFSGCRAAAATQNVLLQHYHIAVGLSRVSTPQDTAGSSINHEVGGWVDSEFRRQSIQTSLASLVASGAQDPASRHRKPLARRTGGIRQSERSELLRGAGLNPAAPV